ncbi:MAG: tRNA glutamyl-Q(34) synthetase GluQRS [Muribaculaceae bacterium]|nr:tRNA glutamyl-Q(34) synthetase GluQRS [Muribaculaceae bacterium]
MHLGNIYTAILSWLSVKSRGGKWILRIEDLDPQRSKLEYARMIEDDLHWLGFEWDEGGLDGKGPNGPYLQSKRHHFYEEALDRLKSTGLCYPCSCTRADILATQAPHESDGRVVYKGTCRPAVLPSPYIEKNRAAVRIAVPDEEITFTDRIKGMQTVNLARHCGDFIVRRGDGAWSYQLAVVVDDALMGVTEVMRGDDLLLSAAQQIYLYRLLGYTPPEFAHVPLVCNEKGIRLSKRDKSLSMEYLRAHHTPEEILGMAAHRASIIPTSSPISLLHLLEKSKLYFSILNNSKF